jgi:S-adenosylmethionine:tRNA ribosyltransferase-isomerase
MLLSELQYDLPDHLIATYPQRPSRVMWVAGPSMPWIAKSMHEDPRPAEVSMQELLQKIPQDALLILNETKVLPRRVFTDSSLEILFLSRDAQDPCLWTVLFPSKKFPVGSQIPLPLGQSMTLLEKGRPQKIRTQEILSEEYFEQVAELPLPPYIQKLRHERHNIQQDKDWYQTAWAKEAGSLACPTASLHFSQQDLQFLENRGVRILKITLHVGLGTFLPVTVEDLNDHPMHEEQVQVSVQVWQEIQNAKKQGRPIMALGTTVTRALESVARGMIPLNTSQANYRGETNLLLQEGSAFHVVDILATNFHQPGSTLLALVMAFAGKENVQMAYQWAKDQQFRFLSYGDLSIWFKKHPQI